MLMDEQTYKKIVDWRYSGFGDTKGRFGTNWMELNIRNDPILVGMTLCVLNVLR